MAFAPRFLVWASLLEPLAAMAQSNWTNPGTGDWYTPGNWSAGVPGAGVDAVIENGGTAVLSSGSGAAHHLEISGGSAFLVSDGADLGLARLLVGYGSNGSMLVTGLGTEVTISPELVASLLIGTNALGTLTIDDGAVVRTLFADGDRVSLGSMSGVPGIC